MFLYCFMLHYVVFCINNYVIWYNFNFVIALYVVADTTCFIFGDEYYPLCMVFAAYSSLEVMYGYQM